MSSVISAPVDWVESVSSLKLPPRADRRLQELMDRNNEGQLNGTEHAELETLVEMSESLSIVRAEAIRLLGASRNDQFARNRAGGGGAGGRPMCKVVGTLRVP